MSASQYRPGVLLLIGFTAVSQIGGAMYTPSLPAMADAFAAPAMTIQLTMTVYLIGYAVAQILVGSLSDRFGRRAIMLSGLALFTVASFAGALAPTIEVLIVIRLIQACGACVGLVVSRAIIRDCFDASQATRYMAYLGMAMGLMPALSPIVGGSLQVWFGWWANFIGMGVIGLAALVGSLIWLRETLSPENRHGIAVSSLIAGYSILLRSPAFLAYASSAGFSTAIFFVFLSGGPLVMIGGYGVSPDVYGFYAMAMPAGFITGNFLASRIAAIVSMDRAIAYGYLLKFAACVTILAAPYMGDFGAARFVVPMVVIGFGAGLITSNSFAGVVRDHPKLAGTASGLSGFMQMASAALATIAMGAIPADTMEPYALLQLSLTLFGALLFWIFIGLATRRQREVQGAE